MAQRYISIQSIVSDLYNHPRLRDITVEEVITHSVELMRIMGCPYLFDDKEAVLRVEGHRAMLPCDFHELRQLALLCDGAIGDKACDGSRQDKEEGTGQAALQQQVDALRQEVRRLKRHAADSHKVDHAPATRPRSAVFHEATGDFSFRAQPRRRELSYRIHGNVLQTSIASGNVLLAYSAMATDEDGWPLIADDAAFLRALKAYVKWRHFLVLQECGDRTITEGIVNRAEQDYCFDIAQASGSLMRVTPERMHNIARILNNWMPRPYEHATAYAGLANEHTIRES